MSHSIKLNYDRAAEVKRLSPIDQSDPDKLDYEQIIECVPCHVQPLTDAFGQDMTGGFGKEWLMFCDSQDILDGDQVILEDGRKYRVMSSERFNFKGEDRHMEIRIRDFE